MEVITICPTRGLIFEKTISSLKKNGITDFITKVGSIPDVQNELVREAMKEYSSYVFFVEDDMEIPEGCIEKMKKMDKAIVSVDYPMDNGYSTICRQSEEILFCGLGCSLVKRGVLEAIGDPWFDISYSWRIKEPFELEKIDNPSKYGGHDINFCMKAREKGFTIHQLEGYEAKHLRCENLQKSGYNDGEFIIKELLPVNKRQQY